MELFPGADLGAARTVDGGCVEPIGRRRVRPRRRRVAQPTTAPLIPDVQALLVQQHLEVLAELRLLRQHGRNEYESLPAVLRRVSEIERHLRLTELHVPQVHTRRQPLGRNGRCGEIGPHLFQRSGELPHDPIARALRIGAGRHRTFEEL